MGEANRNKLTPQDAIREIGEIEEKYCKTCPIKKEFRKKPRNEQEMTEYCFTQCSKGKRIRALGGVLEYGALANLRFKAPELTKENYLKWRDEDGKTDKQIREELGISRATITRRKRAWGLNNNRHYTSPKLTLRNLTKQELEELSRDYSDRQIGKMYGVCARTIGKRRQKWGISREIHLIRNNYTESEYNYLKNRGMLDKEISELWEISASSLLDLKKDWGIAEKKRVCNPDELIENGLTPDKMAELIQKYSDREIAKMYYTYKSTIRKYRTKYRILRKAGRKPKKAG